MKKFLLMISIISILFLTGCNSIIETDNSYKPENINNGQNEISSNIYENKIDNEENNYKLSNKYELDESAYIDLYNVVLIDDNYNERIVENPYKFENNGNEYLMECKRIDGTNVFNVSINGKKVTLPNIDGGIVGIGVIDLDKTDNVKEIVIRRGADGFRSNLLYRINANNELEEISSIRYAQPYIISNKYIFPITLFGDGTSVIGYYIYDNGELKYVDRLLTGEKALNDDEMLPDTIKNKVYTSSTPFIQIVQDGKVLTGIKNNDTLEELFSFKVLNAKLKYNEKSDDNELVYDIELTEDARWIKDSDSDFEEIIPKGTLLKEIPIIYLYD